MNETGRPIDFAIGIDGGGTKTLAVVVDAQGHERGRGQAGSSNYTGVGVEQAVRHIFAAAEEAARLAGRQLPLDAAWVGLAGIDRPDDHALLFPRLEGLARIVYLVNDAELLLSGLEQMAGVALIAGTGSIALARAIDGTVVRVGGWGRILGDEGSGYEMGRLGLQAAVRAADERGPATALLEAILQHWQIPDADAIIGEVYIHDEDTAIARIASLSRLVFAAARAGDQVAQEIVQHAVDELVLAVTKAADKLHFSEHGLPIAMGGGLLTHEPDFRAQVLGRIERLRSLGQVIVVDEPASTAARAALHLT